MSGKGQVELMLGFGALVVMSFCSLSCAGSAVKLGVLDDGGILGGILGSESGTFGLLGAGLAGKGRRGKGALAGALLPMLT